MKENRRTSAATFQGRTLPPWKGVRSHPPNIGPSVETIFFAPV